jgi:hypothetical protein
MASNKTKVALIGALALLLVIGGGLVATWQFMRPRQGAADLQGFWEGTVSVGHMTLRLVLKVEKAPDGTYTATMDSIDQGAADIPVKSVRMNDRTVQFQLPLLRAGYAGDLNARATEMSGEWRQGSVKIPLTFQRTPTPSTIPPPLPVSAYARREDSPLQGVWKGTLEIASPQRFVVPLRLVVRISETSPGEFIGRMDSPDQGARNVPLTTVDYAKPTARFDIAGIDGHFEGTLKDDGSVIDGTWTQAGHSTPCLLTRADPAEDAVPDASAYAYSSDAEVQGIWSGTLNAGAAKLRLVFKIARTADGTYSAAIDSPDQGSKDIQAAWISYNVPDVEAEWPALRAFFHGQLEKGKLVGVWKQGAAEFPLEFERTNRVSSAGARGAESDL